jgi:hypothetical protein
LGDKRRESLLFCLAEVRIVPRPWPTDYVGVARRWLLCPDFQLRFTDHTGLYYRGTMDAAVCAHFRLRDGF